MKNERIDTIGIACKDSQAQIEKLNNNKLELNVPDTNVTSLRKQTDKINIPKLELANINKMNIEYGKFTDDKTNASSILPPSSLGDKAIEISAIQIDKNELSLHMDPIENRRYYYIDENAGMTKCEIYCRNFMIGCALLCCALSTIMFIYGFAININK